MAAMTEIEKLRKQAAELAHGLGITFYIVNGVICQHGSSESERFDPQISYDKRAHGRAGEPANFGGYPLGSG